MTVATFIQPNRTTQSGSAYPSNIDAAIAVVGEIGAQFAAHEQTVPNMTVRVDGGRLRVPNATYVGLVAAQSTGTITAPVGNNRIDRVVLDIASGAVSVVTGVLSGSPVAPAIPRGKASICSVLLTPSTTAITNSIITDERVGHPSIITLSGNWDNAGTEQVLELGSAGSFGADIGTSTPNIFMVNNLIYDGTNWRYVINGTASIVVLNNAGSYEFYTAPSGTAGAVATLSLKFSVDGTTGLASVAGDPTAALGISTKQYVDAVAATLHATFSLSSNMMGVADGSGVTSAGSGTLDTLEVGDLVFIHGTSTSQVTATSGQFFKVSIGDIGTANFATNTGSNAYGGVWIRQITVGPASNAPHSVDMMLRCITAGTLDLTQLVMNHTGVAGTGTVTFSYNVTRVRP